MPPGESLQVETRACCKDGGYRWLRLSAAVAGADEPLVYLSAMEEQKHTVAQASSP